MPKKVTYIAEATGDNILVTIPQLLKMIAEFIEERKDEVTMENGEFTPEAQPRGMFAVVVCERADGTLVLENFRCGLPKFVEVAVIARTFMREMGAAIRDDA